MAKKKTEAMSANHYKDMPIEDKRNPALWTKKVGLLPQPPASVLWKEGDEFHYQKEELRYMPPAHFEVIARMITYRTGGNLELTQTWFDVLTDDELNDGFMNLWRPCDGCIPSSEVGEDLNKSIFEKFIVPLDVACDMAKIIHERKEYRRKVKFTPVPLVEANYEDSTFFAIVDWDFPIRYLFGYEKAWVFKWYSLTSLANWVLSCATQTVQVFHAMLKTGLKLEQMKTAVFDRDCSDTHDSLGNIVGNGK